MKKLLLLAGVLAALLLPGSAAAAPPPPDWNLLGTYTVTFTCHMACEGSYDHTMVITASDATTGAVVGHGVVIGLDEYTWDVTGQVSGSNVSMTFNWTGPNGMQVFNPMNMTGTIDANGGISGTAVDAMGREFTWVTTAGHAVAIVKPTQAPTQAPTAAPTATPTATPFQTQLGATATARSSTTLAPTSTESGKPSQSVPLFALLICLAFGGLGLLVVESQRRAYRR